MFDREPIINPPFVPTSLSKNPSPYTPTPLPSPTRSICALALLLQHLSPLSYLSTFVMPAQNPTLACPAHATYSPIAADVPRLGEGERNVFFLPLFSPIWMHLYTHTAHTPSPRNRSRTPSHGNSSIFRHKRLSRPPPPLPPYIQVVYSPISTPLPTRTHTFSPHSIRPPSCCFFHSTRLPRGRPLPSSGWDISLHPVESLFNRHYSCTARN